MENPSPPEHSDSAGSTPNWETLASRLRAVSQLTADCCWMRIEYPDGRSEREWIIGSFARLTGYETEEFSDLGLQRLVHPDDLSFALGRVKGPEGISEHQFRILTKSGEVRWLEERMRVEPREDGALVVFGSTRDVTLQKIAEGNLRESRVQQHQSQKMEALGMLAGGMAHDFNNLLTVIMGYGEFVRERGSSDPEVSDCVTEMYTAAERAAELTRQLLTFSRQHPMIPRVADLNALVADTIKMLRRLVPSSIDLVTVLEPELPSARLDVAQFEQVLVNLVVNARDALEGTGHIEVVTRRVRMNPAQASRCNRDPAGDFVLLRVRDNGCGIASEDLPRIFEPFFTTKAKGEGTGFGLAAAYGTVAQSGGWIHVESDVGEGASFSVFLPVVLGAAETRVPDLGPGREETGGSETILVVEDEDGVRQLLVQTLDRLGYRVLEAGLPSEAVKLSESHQGRVHLLLTDMVMPELNGRELAARIRSDRSDVRVLYMSGYPEDYDGAAEPLDVEGNFIAKPMRMRDLGRMVRKVLDGAGAAAD